MLGACHANYQRLLSKHYESGKEHRPAGDIDWTSIQSYVLNDNSDAHGGLYAGAILARNGL